MQGPDVRRIPIEVGVFGLVDLIDPEADPDAGDLDSILDLEVKSGDALDKISEEILDLWTPNGILDGKGFADHWFVEVTQGSIFDAPQLAEYAQWVSVFTVIFEDSRDE